MARPRKASLFRNGRFHWVSYWVGDRQVKESTGTDNLKRAKEIRQEREAEMNLAQTELFRQIRLGLSDHRRDAILRASRPIKAESATKVCDLFLASDPDKSPKTIGTDRGRLRDFFSHVRVGCLADVSGDRIQSFLNGRRAGEIEVGLKKKKTAICANTALHYYQVLHALFEYAIKQGYVTENPVKKVKRPEVPERDVKFLSLEGIKHVLTAVHLDLIEALVAVAIYAGLRRGEICWLTWDDICLDENRPSIRICTKSFDGKTWTAKTRKNRTVPVSKDLLPYLLRQKNRNTEGPWFVPSIKGHRWDSDNLGQRLSVLMKRAGIEANFLVFRHTFASQLALKNVSIQKIAALLGNTPDVAEKHYAHLRSQDLADEVDFGSRFTLLA